MKNYSHVNNEEENSVVIAIITIAVTLAILSLVASVFSVDEGRISNLKNQSNNKKMMSKVGVSDIKFDNTSKTFISGVITNHNDENLKNVTLECALTANSDTKIYPLEMIIPKDIPAKSTLPFQLRVPDSWYNATLEKDGYQFYVRIHTSQVKDVSCNVADATIE